VRKSVKFCAAYVQPMLDSEEADGRVHCSMRAIGTVTSRQSARDPALQQLPKRKDKRVRAAYVAPDGWVIVSADLKQGEPRTMAALSGDRNLQRDIEAGDINNALAALTYGQEFVAEEGKDASKPSYQLRDRGKRGFLSRCYGAGVRKLSSILGKGMEQARSVMSTWDAEYPQLADYAEKCNNLKAVVLDSGWIVPLWDRYRRNPDGTVFCTDKPSRKGLNAATQGNQAYILRIAVHRLIDWGWSWALIMLVHDEIVGCVPVAMQEQFKAALEAAMTMDFHGFPIRCDATIEGRSWMPQTDFEEYEAAELIRETSDV
jgi:DNA polymerase-1